MKKVYCDKVCQKNYTKIKDRCKSKRLIQSPSVQKAQVAGQGNADPG